MNHNKTNNIYPQPKIRVTLDGSVPVKDERPVARLHKLFQGFKQRYSLKGAVKR